jgi:hypothetical protein
LAEANISIIQTKQVLDYVFERVFAVSRVQDANDIRKI